MKSDSLKHKIKNIAPRCARGSLLAWRRAILAGRATSAITFDGDRSSGLLRQLGEYMVVPLSGKKQVVLYQKYTYSFKNTKKTHAYCSKYIKKKCQARLTFDADRNMTAAYTKHNHPPPIFIKDEFSGTFRYYTPQNVKPAKQNKTIRGEKILNCTDKIICINTELVGRNCNGRTYDAFRARLKELIYHHRQGSIGLMFSQPWSRGVEVIQLADNGPMVYMYQNYTFAMQGAHKEYGTCSRRTSRKCKAKFKLNEYGEIISAQTYHNHPPPKLVKTSNGRRLPRCPVSKRQVSYYVPQLHILLPREREIVIEMFAENECELITLNGRKVLLYQGYTFSQHGVSPRNRYCSKKLSMKCPASLVIDAEGNVVVFKKGHNHPPPRILRVKSGMYVTCGGVHIERICVGKQRKQLIMISNYTFARTTTDDRYWNCSKKYSTKCPAKLRFSDSGALLHYELDHNHEPPSYFKTKAGHYVKLS
ncbi:unnamed protein product [Spodoptera exigua]|nr:unnamed protein product [Spodoptera exigua]